MPIILTDTQIIIVAAACNRPDRNLLPLPSSIRGGAIAKVAASLVSKGLATEQPAQPGQPHWRRNDDDMPVALVATAAAFAALNIEAPATDTDLLDVGDDAVGPTGNDDDGIVGRPGPGIDAAAPAPAAPGRPFRPGTKQARLVAMLETGATVPEIAPATGWLHHTVRGTIAGALKKRLGLTVTSEKVVGRGRVYKIEP